MKSLAEPMKIEEAELKMVHKDVKKKLTYEELEQDEQHQQEQERRNARTSSRIAARQEAQKARETQRKQGVKSRSLEQRRTKFEPLKAEPSDDMDCDFGLEQSEESDHTITETSQEPDALETEKINLLI